MAQAKAKKFEVIWVRRGPAVQGGIVEADMEWEGQKFADISMPFAQWIKFKRLLEKGLEQDAREQHALALRIKFTGKEAEITKRDDSEAEVDKDIQQAMRHAATHANDRENQGPDRIPTPRVTEEADLPAEGEVKPGALRSLRS